MATGGSDDNGDRRWRKREQETSDELEYRSKSPKASKTNTPSNESPPLIDLTTPTSNETHTPHQDTPPPPPPPPRRNIIRLGPLSVDLTDGRAVQLNPIPSIHVFQGRQFLDEDEELEFILNATRRTLQHSPFTIRGDTSSTNNSTGNTTTNTTSTVPTSNSGSTTTSSGATGTTNTTTGHAASTSESVVIIDSDSDEDEDVVVTSESRSNMMDTARDIARRFQSLLDQHFEDIDQSEGSGASRRDPFRTESGEEIYIRRTIHPTVIFSTIIGGPPEGFPFIGGNSMGSYEDLLELAERLGPGRSQGLTEEVISSLPVKIHTNDDIDPQKLSCIICMTDYLEGESKKILPCNHDYHVTCIDPWLKEHKTCPVCRKDVIT